MGEHSRPTAHDDGRYHRLVESIPYAFWAVDLEGRLVEVNQELVELFGYPEEELVGSHFARLVDEDDLAAAERVFEATIAGGVDTTELDLWIRRGDGGRRLVHAAVCAVREDGEVVGSHGLARDVTEERAAAERVRRSEQRLKVLLHRVPVILWTVDRDLVFTSGTGRGLDALDLFENERVGQSLFEYFGTSDRGFPPIRAHLEALEGRTQTYQFEWQGQTFEVRVEPLREEGRIVGAIGAALDVTDRLDAERKIVEQRIHLQKLFEVAPEAIVLLTADDRVLEVNPEFERLFGYTEEEARGRTIGELIVPPTRHGEAVALSRRVAGGERVSVEAIRQRKDGTPVHVSVLGATMDVGGERRVYGIYRDITEQKELEEQLHHSQRMEAVGQLAGGIAHDFNNILTAILGHSRVLVREVPEGWIQNDLREIEAAAERAAALTGQLLTFSRRQVVEPRNVDVNCVVTAMEALLRRLIGDQVRMDLEMDESVGTVIMDPAQLEQVVMNLVLNARDAMASGGTVRVRTGRGRDEAEGGADGTTRDHVVLEVVDTGTGMSEEERARMFEPFFTTKGVGEGTGLGLSTVYGIVDQAGGWIEVDSAPGRGTSMRVFLPRAEGVSADPGTVHQEEEDAAGGRETILLVDDDRAVREVTRRILGSRGYTVITAGSGKEALDLARALDRPPDLLLTDMVMAGMEGETLASEVGEIFPGISVLFMSGYTESTLAHGSAEDSHFIPKPFDPNTLARRVREALG